MSDAIFIANKASGHLAIGDKKEMDKATWRKSRGHPVKTYLSLYPRQAVPQARLSHLILLGGGAVSEMLPTQRVKLWGTGDMIKTLSPSQANVEAAARTGR
jgi:hypothetical protein